MYDINRSELYNTTDMPNSINTCWNLLEHKEISHKSYAKPKDIFLCKMVSVGHIVAEHNWVVEHLRRRHHQNDRTTDIYGDRGYTYSYALN